MSRHPQQGFTLLEVIIAFGVLALALTLLLGTLSGATRQVKDADLASRAGLHAQSLLAQVGVGEWLQPGQRSGTFEDGCYRWTLRIDPWRDPDPPARSDPSAPQLLQLALKVTWGDAGPRETLQIDSLRYVRMQQPGMSGP